MIGFSSSGTTGGAVDKMGGPASFYLMSLARSVPEFSSTMILTIVGSAIIAVIMAMYRLAPFHRK